MRELFSAFEKANPDIHIAYDTSPDLGIVMAVSYTHLDVYKRQGLRPSADRANRTPNWFRSRISTWIWYPVLSTSSGSATGSFGLHLSLIHICGAGAGRQPRRADDLGKL